MNRETLAGVVLLAAFAAAGHGQTAIDLRTQTKSVDFSKAALTKPVKTGTTLPAVCGIGEMFFQTDALPGGNLYGCTAANTWTLLSPDWTGGDVGGSFGALVVQGLQGNAVTPGLPADRTILRWNATTNRWEFAEDSAHTHLLSDLQGITGKHGSGSLLQTFAGSAPHTSDCAQFDADGNIVSSGTPCGTSSGGVPYTGATQDLNLGTRHLSAASVNTASSGTPSRIQMTQGTCPTSADAGFDLAICVEAGQLYSVNLAGAKTVIGSGGGGGSGNVTGPASSTDMAIAAFSGTNGALLRNTASTVDPTSGNIRTPGSLTTGYGTSAAGSVTAQRGTGTAKLGVQGATAGEWSITPAASFTSWNFTPPTAPCGAHQWWTTDSNGVGNCTQPAASDMSDAAGLMRTSTTVQASQMPAMTGDAASTAGSTATTVAKVNGVTYPGSPAVNSVPLVTTVNAATYMPIPDCTDSAGNHLNYNAATHSFSCGSTGGSVASAGFSGLTSGTNSSATMTCGTGCIVSTSGGGVVNANQINGSAAAASATTDATNAGNISSGTLAPSRLASAARIRGFGITMDGNGQAITTGQKGYAQIGYACTIVGWSILADQAGSISVTLDRHASPAPPSAPAIPNTTTDKISASTPISLSSVQSAAGGASEVSTWTTSIGQWDSIGWDVTSANTLTRATIQVFCQI